MVNRQTAPFAVSAVVGVVGVLVALALVLTFGALLTPGAAPVQAQSPDPSTPPDPSEPSQTPDPPGSPEHSPHAEALVIRIQAATVAESRRVVALGLDMLSMREGADLFALVSPARYEELRAAGWPVRIDQEQTALLRRFSLQQFLGGYSTVEQTEQQLHTLAETYPRLTRLVDVGDSWLKQRSNGEQGYDLWALHISSPVSTTAAPRPVFFLVATVHAREIAVSEVAMRFSRYLLENYGSDPDVTWLLDAHEIVVVPMANPDGHKLAEREWFQRKNLNDTNGNSDACAFPPSISNQIGVDLNRNFGSFVWGTIASPDTSPCSAIYPGPLAASEPETQAIQNLVRSLYPNHTSRPAEGEAAPPDTSGVLISLHSYSNLVLWPWGHTSQPAPNAAGLERLGRRMAKFNGYSPSQAVWLYPTSGTTDEWSYSELGIASYTFEIGPTRGICGGFLPPYRCMDAYFEQGGDFWQRNLPALLYAARVTSAPYALTAGPDLEVLRVFSDTTTLTVTASLPAEEPMNTVNLYVGLPPLTSTTATTPTTRTGQLSHTVQMSYALELITGTTALTPTDAQHWQVVLPLDELRAACADTSGVSTPTTRTCYALASEETSDLRPLLFVRGQNAAGAWGPLFTTWAVGNATPPATPTTEPPVYRLWLPRVGE